MKIDLNELLKATKALINTIGNKNGNEIEVGADYYWSIDLMRFTMFMKSLSN